MVQLNHAFSTTKASCLMEKAEEFMFNLTNNLIRKVTTLYLAINVQAQKSLPINLYKMVLTYTSLSKINK